MKILVIGSGGREHALVWKLCQSPRVSTVYCAPGNGGIEAHARCVPIDAGDIAGLQHFVKSEGIDLTMVGPEGPLSNGLVNEFRKAKLKVVGPTQGAAKIESSKGFAKELMRRHAIPTASANSFNALAPALRYIDEGPVPIVVKADGLAQGKGVIVAMSYEEAHQAVKGMLEEKTFGEAGSRVLIEEFIDGEEISVMAFTDGKAVVPMVAAQDHKRVGEGDSGPNTGGMGAYAPAPIASPMLIEKVTNDVLHPIVNALSQVGCPFQGILYAGIMLRNGVPYVLEFNARFGDPETQVVLPLLKTDLVDILEAIAEHRLDQLPIEWHDQAAVCVVLSSGGYPAAYTTGFPIGGLDVDSASDGVMVFHSGTKRQGLDVVTAGGRVLGVTATGQGLTEARDRAYQVVQGISFKDSYYRSDIGARALASSFPHQ